MMRRAVAPIRSGNRSGRDIARRPMIRFLYLSGFANIALCGTIIGQELAEDTRLAAAERNVPDIGARSRYVPLMSGDQWFTAAKPCCNPVEVETRLRSVPPPASVQGVRFAAAMVLYNVARPVADAGDDRAAGPMMELVLEYWPYNSMALYHAGMSDPALGQTTLAEQRLHAFLQLYPPRIDEHTVAARSALQKIATAKADGRLPARPIVRREGAARP